MATLAPLFLIRSFQFLQVARTTMTFLVCSHFGDIQLRTAELAALVRLKNSHKLIMGTKLWPL